MQEPKCRQAKSQLVRCVEAKLNTKEIVGLGSTMPV